MSCKFNFKCVVTFINIVVSLLLSRTFIILVKKANANENPPPPPPPSNSQRKEILRVPCVWLIVPYKLFFICFRFRYREDFKGRVTLPQERPLEQRFKVHSSQFTVHSSQDALKSMAPNYPSPLPGITNAICLYLSCC